MAHRVRRIRSDSLRVALERNFSERLLARFPTTGRSTTDTGAVIGVDTADIIQRSIAVSGRWEPVVSEVLLALLSPGDSFVDVGANVGYYSLLAAQRIGSEGHLLAIEASPTVHAGLVANLRSNGIDPSAAVHAALFDGGDTVEVGGVEWANLGAVQVLGDGMRPGGATDVVSVPAGSLGALAAAVPRDRPAVVKIDIEGGEFTARHGIEAYVEDGPEELAVLIEVAPGTAHGFEVTQHDAAGDEAHRGMVRRLADAGGMQLYAIPNTYGPSGRYPSTIEPVRPVEAFEEGIHDYLLVRGEQFSHRLDRWLASLGDGRSGV